MSSPTGFKQRSKMAFLCLLLLFAAAHAVPVRQSQGCNFHISLPIGGSTGMTPPSCNAFRLRQCSFSADSPAGTTIRMHCFLNIGFNSFFTFYPGGSSPLYWTAFSGNILQSTNSNAFLVLLTDNCNTAFSCTLHVIGDAETTTDPSTPTADPT